MDWGGSSLDWGEPPKSTLSHDDDLVLDWTNDDDEKGYVKFNVNFIDTYIYFF